MLGTKFSRQLVLNALIALAIEFALIYGVCVLIADKWDSPFANALWGIAALYAFRVVNALINMVITTAVYSLTKKQRVSAITAMFYHHKIPVNDETMFADSSALLEAIAASQDTSPEAKHFALKSLGEFSGIRVCNRMLALMQMHTVMDAAWERYRSEVNAKAAIASV